LKKDTGVALKKDRWIGIEERTVWNNVLTPGRMLEARRNLDDHRRGASNDSYRRTGQGSRQAGKQAGRHASRQAARLQYTSTLQNPHSALDPIETTLHNP